MKLTIKYFRPMAYGNFTTLHFEEIYPEDTLIAQIKRLIFKRLHIEPKDQKLSV